VSRDLDAWFSNLWYIDSSVYCPPPWHHFLLMKTVTCSASCIMPCASSWPVRQSSSQLFTSDKGGSTCFARVRLSVCLLARLLKNACMDLDEMLRVDRCRDMDELINFLARSGS